MAMSGRDLRMRRGRAVATVSATAAGLGGCSHGILDPAGPVGGAERVILFDALAIMLCIVVPTIVATLACAWWFRAGNDRARRLPDWSFSGRVEVVTWSVPLLTILFLGGIAWVGSHELDPAKPLAPPVATADAKPLDVQVVALDWKWLFIYPDQGVASLNRLVIPAHVPVHFSLTSASVMNTFFVPQLGSMIYVMNGMADQLNLQADREGTFPGLSGHFSGDGFSDMHFDAVAMARSGFDAWVAGAKGAGPRLDAAAYAALSRQSTGLPPMTYGDVAPDLFEHVVLQHIPPGPGPEPASPPKPRAETDAKLDPKAGG
ncbi:ubiquinol oxidase subunit II [Lichenibacterium ramalinae]|uniref:Ubiquinol oxidase subunit 2 n=1 Tax=Lichenibacterium ramalinae TaxID=2316527 RepID=A0A4Q2RC39_9HYPH|nr:ubiquinol oxidase subunit II [Lichenibacterium ramalinae]